MLDSSNDTVAILYDIENAPIEMLQYTMIRHSVTAPAA